MGGGGFGSLVVTVHRGAAGYNKEQSFSRKMKDALHLFKNHVNLIQFEIGRVNISVCVRGRRRDTNVEPTSEDDHIFFVYFFRRVSVLATRLLKLPILHF
jgi:hypothetical protein